MKILPSFLTSVLSSQTGFDVGFGKTREIRNATEVFAFSDEIAHQLEICVTQGIIGFFGFHAFSALMEFL